MPYEGIDHFLIRVILPWKLYGMSLPFFEAQRQPPCTSILHSGLSSDFGDHRGGVKGLTSTIRSRR